jgi:hypothetical protein
VVPAHQRLGADDAAGAQVHDRLVLHVQRLVGDRPAQADLQVEPLLRPARSCGSNST